MRKISVTVTNSYRIIKPDTTPLSRGPSGNRETQSVTEPVKTLGVRSVRKVGNTGQVKIVTRGAQMRQGGEASTCVELGGADYSAGNTTRGKAKARRAYGEKYVPRALRVTRRCWEKLSCALGAGETGDQTL